MYNAFMFVALNIQIIQMDINATIFRNGYTQRQVVIYYLYMRPFLYIS